MTMPLTIQGTIITDGKEKRLNGNTFELQLEGYHLFLMNSPVNVKKTEKSSEAATAHVLELTFKNDSTILLYEVDKLYGVN